MAIITKKHLQKLRDNVWDSHMSKDTSFMVKHGIEISDMEGNYVVRGRRKLHSELK